MVSFRDILGFMESIEIISEHVRRERLRRGWEDGVRFAEVKRVRILVTKRNAVGGSTNMDIRQMQKMEGEATVPVNSRLEALSSASWPRRTASRTVPLCFSDSLYPHFRHWAI